MTEIYLIYLVCRMTTKISHDLMVGFKSCILQKIIHLYAPNLDHQWTINFNSMQHYYIICSSTLLKISKIKDSILEKQRGHLTVIWRQTYLPSIPAIRTVFCDPNATINLVLSGKRNCANDHSELKYFGKTPTIFLEKNR
jgi:hypothetical protein